MNKNVLLFSVIIFSLVFSSCSGSDERVIVPNLSLSDDCRIKSMKVGSSLDERNTYYLFYDDSKRLSKVVGLDNSTLDTTIVSNYEYENEKLHMVRRRYQSMTSNITEIQYNGDTIQVENHYGNPRELNKIVDIGGRRWMQKTYMYGDRPEQNFTTTSVTEVQNNMRGDVISANTESYRDGVLAVTGNATIEYEEGSSNFLTYVGLPLQVIRDCECFSFGTMRLNRFSTLNVKSFREKFETYDPQNGESLGTENSEVLFFYQYDSLNVPSLITERAARYGKEEPEDLDFYFEFEWDCPE